MRGSLIMMKPRVIVLRLGHRRERDKRISTHVGLVARAFGAIGIVYAGDVEESILNKLRDVTERFGGEFQANVIDDPKKYLERARRKGHLVVHLTMYGQPLLDVINQIRGVSKGVVVVVGAEKVPRWVYEISDFNVSVTSQPHSEVAALAVFLDRLYDGKEFYMEFKGAKIQVVPSKRGKRVVRV